MRFENLHLVHALMVAVSFFHPFWNKTGEELWEAIRSARDELLMKADWTAASDHSDPLPEDVVQVWIAYRQKLRDITLSFDNPKEVIWPERPK